MEIWEIEGLITIDDRIRLTSSGYTLCDELTLRLISALEKAVGEEWHERFPIPEEPRDDEQYFSIL